METLWLSVLLNCACHDSQFTLFLWCFSLLFQRGRTSSVEKIVARRRSFKGSNKNGNKSSVSITEETVFLETKVRSFPNWGRWSTCFIISRSSLHSFLFHSILFTSNVIFQRNMGNYSVQHFHLLYRRKCFTGKCTMHMKTHMKPPPRPECYIVHIFTSEAVNDLISCCYMVDISKQVLSTCIMTRKLYGGLKIWIFPW